MDSLQILAGSRYTKIVNSRTTIMSTITYHSTIYSVCLRWLDQMGLSVHFKRTQIFPDKNVLYHLVVCAHDLYILYERLHAARNIYYTR